MPSFQVPVLGSTVRFLSRFPASLPQPFHRCLPSAFASCIFRFWLAFFRPLTFRFQLLSLCFSFPSLPGFASQLLPRCPIPLSLPRLPLSLRPDFACLPSRFLYSALLMVSFRPSLTRSRSCSSGAYLVLSLSVFPLPIRFLSSASLPVLATQPLFLPFLLFPASPHSGFSGAPFRFRFPAFPVPSSPVSRALFPGFCTRLSVCFLSPFPDSLPQPFLRCFPFAFAFGLSPSDPLSFVRFSSGSGYSASVSSFPLLPRFASQRLIGCCPSAFRLPGFSASVPPGFPCFTFASRTRLSVCFLSSFPVSLPQPFHRCFLLAFAFGLSPCFAFFRPLSLGSDYSAFRPFLSLLPVFPCRRFPRCFFPLPSGLFPCLPSDSGTRLAAFPFSVRRLATQQLPRLLSLLPFGFRLLSLSFRFRFWLLGFGLTSFSDASHSLHTFRLRSELLYTTIQLYTCQPLFSIFSRFFSKSCFLSISPVNLPLECFKRMPFWRGRLTSLSHIRRSLLRFHPKPCCRSKSPLRREVFLKNSKAASAAPLPNNFTCSRYSVLAALFLRNFL